MIFIQFSRLFEASSKYIRLSLELNNPNLFCIKWTGCKLNKDMLYHIQANKTVWRGIYS